uniref:Uncharacterized protein AlNc14C115G6524 n=1 Tax=Albugo laibachii Nc14 TaxID=890382 RepID=F0WIY8_9STRA|nr:hypothetical protein PITG_05829 [Albugo laibachii Nc14]|eukprot:CCA21234.1 hypothetical protein PITG_05829 [Albugo laibachii Nc14]
MQADQRGDQVFAALWSRFKRWRRHLTECESSSVDARSIYSLDSVLAAKEWVYSQTGIECAFHFTIYHDAAMSRVIDRKKLKELLCDRSACQKHRNATVSAVCVLHRDIGGRSALHHAVVHGQFDLITYLLRRKDARIQLHLRDRQGATPLDLIFKCMGRKRSSIESKALWKQYSHTADKMLALLCENSVSLYQVRDKYGQNIAVLDWKIRGDAWDSFRSGDLIRLRQLVQTYGERILSEGSRLQDLQRTGLHEACESKQVSILVYLLEKLSSQRHFTDSSGCTTLHYAAMRGSMRACLLILGEQTDHEGDSSLISMQDHAGRTALHWSLLGFCHTEVAKALAERCQESVQIVDHDGLTPLHLAISHAQVDLVKMFVSFGANVNAAMSFSMGSRFSPEASIRPWKRTTKSEDACQQPSTKESKAEQHVKQTLSPLTFSIRCGFKLCLEGYSASLVAIIEVLLWAGALPNGSSFEGIQLTPLTEAFRCLNRLARNESEAEQAFGDTCIVIWRLLLSHGAKRYATDIMEQLILSLSMRTTNEKLQASMISWSKRKQLSNERPRNIDIQTADEILPQLLLYIDPVSHSIYHGMLWQCFMLQSFQILIMVQEIHQNQSLAIDTRAKIAPLESEAKPGMPSISKHTNSLWDVLYSQAIATWDEERRCFKINKPYRRRLPALQMTHLLFLQQHYEAHRRNQNANPLTNTENTLEQLFLFCKKKWLTNKKAEASRDRKKLVQSLLSLRQLLAYESSKYAEKISWSCFERKTLVGILIPYDTAFWLGTCSSDGILDLLWELVVERLCKLETRNLFVLDLVLSYCPVVMSTKGRELYARRWLCRLQACAEASTFGSSARGWMLSARSILYACAWNLSKSFVEQIVDFFLRVTRDSANSPDEASVLDMVTGNSTLNGHNAIGWAGIYHRWDILSLMLGYARESISTRGCIQLVSVMAGLLSSHETNARVETRSDWVDLGLDDANILFLNESVASLLESNEDCLHAACKSIIQHDSLTLFEYLFDKVWHRDRECFQAYAEMYAIGVPAIGFVGHMIQCNATLVLGRCIEFAQDRDAETYERWLTKSLLDCDREEDCFTISQQFGFWKLKLQLLEYFSKVDVPEKSAMMTSNSPSWSSRHSSLPSSIPGFFRLLMSLHASRRPEKCFLHPADKIERRESRKSHLESLRGSLQIACALDLDTHLEAFRLQGWLCFDKMEMTCLVTLMQTAIRNGSIKVFNWLLHHTKDTVLALPNITLSDAHLLWTAVLRHDSLLYAQMTEKLLECGLQPGRLRGDGSGFTILHRVATYPDVSLFQKILKVLKALEKSESDVRLDWNVLDAMGNTPIVYAITSGRLYNACVLCRIESVRLEAEFEGQSAFYYSSHLLPNAVWRYVFQQVMMKDRRHAYLHCEVENCGCKGFEMSTFYDHEKAQCGACDHNQSHHTSLPFPPWYLDFCDSYRCPFTADRCTLVEGIHARLSDAKLLKIAKDRFVDLFAEFELKSPTQFIEGESDTHCCVERLETSTPEPRVMRRQGKKPPLHRSIVPKVRRWSGSSFLPHKLSEEACWSMLLEGGLRFDTAVLNSTALSLANVDMSMLHPASCRCQQSTMCINGDTWLYYCISRWLRRVALDSPIVCLTTESAFHLWRSIEPNSEKELLDRLSSPAYATIDRCIKQWKNAIRIASFRQWKRSVLSNKRLQEQSVDVAESLAGELSQSRLKRLQNCQRRVEWKMHECMLHQSDR